MYINYNINMYQSGSVVFLSLLLKMEGFFTFVAVFDGSECDGGYDDVFNHMFLKAYIFQMCN